MNDELIANVKAWVADPTKGPVLHDILQAGVGRIIERMCADDFGAAKPYSDEELARRVAASEEMSTDVARAIGLGSYWGHPALRPVWPAVVSRLANGVDRSGGLEVWLGVRLYPALLVMYTGGVAAVATRRHDTLAALLTEATVYDPAERHEAVLRLHPHGVIDFELARRLPGLERHYTPMSDRLAEVLRPWLAEIMPIQADFDRQFDRFEFLLGLVHYDIRSAKGRPWAPVGRFSWRRDGGIDAEVLSEIEQRGLLSEGLFAGSKDRLTESVNAYKQHIAAVRKQRL